MSQKFLTKLKEFEAAHDDYVMIGSMHPEHHAEIELTYKTCRQELIDMYNKAVKAKFGRRA